MEKSLEKNKKREARKFNKFYPVFCRVRIFRYQFMQM